MREILFRGKLSSTHLNKEWSYGNLMVHSESVMLTTPGKQPIGKYGRVYPKTVGQYTGFTDKNGKKIFEDDILEFTNSDNEKSKYLVIWDEYFWGIEDERGCKDDMKNWEKYREDWEIIGNIHDNPEEGKQNGWKSKGSC